MADATWHGGVAPEDDFDFDEMEISVQPMSTEYVSSERRQLMANLMLDTLLKVAPAIMQFPFYNWRQLLSDYFQAMNIPNAEDYVNWMLVQVQQQMMMMAAVGAGPTAESDGGPVSAQKGPQMQRPTHRRQMAWAA